MCRKFCCDEKVKSLKKNFGSKHGPSEVSEESGVVVGAVWIFFFVCEDACKCNAAMEMESVALLLTAKRERGVVCGPR